MPVQGGLSVERMCRISGVSRAGYYRSLAEEQPEVEQMLVRSAIQQVVLEHGRRYGYRRVTRELRTRGLMVNHKRVLRMMREDNLLAVQPRQFVVTTDSEHSLEVAVNLAWRLNLSGINQLWVADITYIQLQREFVYLAVVLDGFSRKVVGWALSRSLSSRFTLAALAMAIEEREPGPGLVHHSDRGVQYACREYAVLLEKHQMLASMSRPGNPYDNARCESFMRTLKREEINARSYRDLEDLQANIAVFIDEYYNQKRLHSALGYLSPCDFEQTLANRETPKAATMIWSFGKTSTRLLGPGTHTPSPAPDPNPRLDSVEVPSRPGRLSQDGVHPKQKDCVHK